MFDNNIVMAIDDKTDAYLKNYYDANKTKLIRQIVARQKQIRNSDKVVEDIRHQLINDLNNGIRKFVQLKHLKIHN